MPRILGRVEISYWPLLNMYSENFGFGLGGFYYWGDLFKSEEVIRNHNYGFGKIPYD